MQDLYSNCKATALRNQGELAEIFSIKLWELIISAIVIELKNLFPKCDYWQFYLPSIENIPLKECLFSFSAVKLAYYTLKTPLEVHE